MPSSKKKPAAKKVTKVAEKKVKRIKTFTLVLSAEELTHVRDVMGIILPPDGSIRLSESLAVTEKRQMTESKLWAKVVNLCMEANLPVGDDAPDFFVGVSGPLNLGCFQLDVSNNEGGDEE